MITYKTYNAHTSATCHHRHKCGGLIYISTGVEKGVNNCSKHNERKSKDLFANMQYHDVYDFPAQYKKSKRESFKTLLNGTTHVIHLHKAQISIKVINFAYY